MQQTEHPQRIKTRHTLNGIIIEIDRKSWAMMMTAISEASDHTSDKEWAAKLRALRSALSKG